SLEPEPVPAVVPVRPRDPRASRAPGRALHADARPRGAGVKARRDALQLLGPVSLVVSAGIVGAFVSQTTEIYFVTALISVSTVVAIYVFVGNSGVLSFGHISFFAVGVWAAGVLSIPEAEKPATMPYLFDSLSSTTVGNVPSLQIEALVRPAAHAALRPRRWNRDVRRARDHEQHPPVLREDRARAQHVLVRSGDD